MSHGALALPPCAHPFCPPVQAEPRQVWEGSVDCPCALVGARFAAAQGLAIGWLYASFRGTTVLLGDCAFAAPDPASSGHFTLYVPGLRLLARTPPPDGCVYSGPGGVELPAGTGFALWATSAHLRDVLPIYDLSSASSPSRR